VTAAAGRAIFSARKTTTMTDNDPNDPASQPTTGRRSRQPLPAQERLTADARPFGGPSRGWLTPHTVETIILVDDTPTK
jgi:hypothetical protein